ncbi:MAG: hypothetical protein PVH88_00275 [Ignavibacteria bacterium]|jgi:hypothetical protein
MENVYYPSNEVILTLLYDNFKIQFSESPGFAAEKITVTTGLCIVDNYSIDEEKL